jgi:hypothetical protein
MIFLKLVVKMMIFHNTNQLNWMMKLLNDDDDDDDDGNDMLVVIFHKTKQLQWMVRLLKLAMEMLVEFMFIMTTEIVVTAVKDVVDKSSIVGKLYMLHPVVCHSK